MNSGRVARPFSSRSISGKPHRIAVEDQVRLRRKTLLPQVHQQEGEIVEDVDGGDQLVELDGVERGRHAIEERDVAEMEVAMATPDAPRPPALEEKGPQPTKRRLHCRGKFRRIVLREDHVSRGELPEGLPDHTAERPRRRHAVVDLRLAIGCEQQLDEPHHQRRAEFATLGDMIERAGLVEPPHVNGPFDRLAFAADPQPLPLPRDRNGAEIDVGRIALVDGDLRLAGTSPPGEGRLIEEGEADGALDLVNVEADEEHHRGVGIDPDHRQDQAVGLPVGEEGEHIALVDARRRAARPLSRLP